MIETVHSKSIRSLVSTTHSLVPMATNAFRDLNLGEMPETRSQTKLGELQKGRKPTNHNRGRGRGRQTSTRTAEILDSNPISPLGLTEGLISELCVDRLQRHELPRGAYYAFQLKRPISVRIFSPESGERKIECSCEDHQQNNSVCSHISVSFLQPSRGLNHCY